MNEEEEEIEFQMNLMDEVFGELKIDYPKFSHAAIKCVHEILDQIPGGIQSFIISDLCSSSKQVLSIVREIMVRYFELENFKDQINIKENTNG